MSEHDCEWLSMCCGAEPNEYVDYFCSRCNEGTTFECEQCDIQAEEATHVLHHRTYQSGCTFCNTQAETERDNQNFEQAEIAYTNEKGADK